MKKLLPIKEEMISVYLQLVKENSSHPNRVELKDRGISRDQVRRQFGNLTKLKEYIIKTFPEKLTKIKEESVSLPKILLLDIETAPIEAYVWGLWENNVALNQISKDWSILSWSAKWLDKDEIMYQDQRKARNVRDDKKLLKGIWQLLDSADIILTQNGKNFDEKKLNARFILNGFSPPSSFRHIDTLKIAKKHFGFTSNKLEYMCKALGVKHKKQDHKKFPGFELWKECLKGNLEAWQEMEHYNKFDVLALEGVFKKLAPWTNNVVNFNVYHKSDVTVCNCGSSEFKKNGFHYTNTSKFQRYKCSSCSSEMRDKKNLVIGSKKIGTK